jgi:hypothetical protein
MLNRLIISTNVLAKTGVTIFGSVGPKISLSIVLATPSTPMPAVMLKQRTIQRSQNCGVFIASFTPTACVNCSAGGFQPAGSQPGAGMR